MAVAVLSAPVSMTAEQYDRVLQQLEAAGAGDPPGRRFHACVGQGDHLVVFEVWESGDDCAAFGERLMPILAREHIELAPTESLVIHRLVESGDVSALRRTIAELREKAFFIRPVEKLREKLHKATEKHPGEDTPNESATN